MRRRMLFWVVLCTFASISILCFVLWGEEEHGTVCAVLWLAIISVVLWIQYSPRYTLVPGLILYCVSIAVLIIGFAAVYTRTGLVDARPVAEDNAALEREADLEVGGTRSVLEERIAKDFGSALYFSAITWATVGYGELHPVTNARWIAGLEAILGYIYMGLLIGIVVNAIFLRKALQDYDGNHEKRECR